MTDYDAIATSLRVCVDKDKGCDDCPYMAKCLTNKSGKHVAMVDAADAIAELSRFKAECDGCSDKTRRVIEKLQKMIPHWIPVTERLPETASDVLVAFRLPIEKRYFITKTQRASWSEKRKHDAFYQRGVTHWMEMPEPPKEETE